MIFDLFGCNNISFFSFLKKLKIFRMFCKFLGRSRKNTAGHKTPNFENFRNFFCLRYNDTLIVEGHKTQKNLGCPKFISDSNTVAIRYFLHHIKLSCGRMKRYRISIYPLFLKKSSIAVLFTLNTSIIKSTNKDYSWYTLDFDFRYLAILPNW